MFKKKCNFCKKKTTKKSRRNNLDDQGKQVIVCLQCAEYAERRAYRKA
ncbi:hypothetical protein SPD48_08295 [Pseudogracilibacillus sp. SE30717A]